MLVLAGLLGACDFIEPEVGEPLSACVDADSDPAHDVDFARDIRPRFDNKVPGVKGCASCHYPVGTREGLDSVGLDLETLGKLRKGGVNTRQNIVVPGSPCKSAIVQKLRGTFGGASATSRSAAARMIAKARSLAISSAGLSCTGTPDSNIAE